MIRALELAALAVLVLTGSVIVLALVAVAVLLGMVTLAVLEVREALKGPRL